MLLVIGYGNELRRDDGLGPRVARAVAEWGILGVRSLAVQQLTPELADDLARAEQAVFVDAAADGDLAVLSLQPVWAAVSNSPINHVSSPPALLALVDALYGRQPAAWLLTIPAHNLDFGERLSPEAEKEVLQALHYLRAWIGPQETAPQ